MLSTLAVAITALHICQKETKFPLLYSLMHIEQKQNRPFWKTLEKDQNLRSDHGL